MVQINSFSLSIIICDFFQSESKPVQMMHQIKKFPFNYVPDYNLQIVELPYVDEELSMFVLLPEEATDGSNPLVKVYCTQPPITA